MLTSALAALTSPLSLNPLPAVDEENYRWEAVLYFYLTWEDPYAFDSARGAPRAYGARPVQPHASLPQPPHLQSSASLTSPLLNPADSTRTR